MIDWIKRLPVNRDKKRLKRPMSILVDLLSVLVPVLVYFVLMYVFSWLECRQIIPEFFYDHGFIRICFGLILFVLFIVIVQFLICFFIGFMFFVFGSVSLRELWRFSIRMEYPSAWYRQT